MGFMSVSESDEEDGQEDEVAAFMSKGAKHGQRGKKQSVLGADKEDADKSAESPDESHP